MSLRERVMRLLNRGDPPDADPTELVEIALVPLAQAPLLVSGLNAAGFEAKFAEAFNLVTKSNADARILVQRRDATAATRVLDELR